MQSKHPFVGYEYKEVTVPSEYASEYYDCYGAFGWERDSNFTIYDGLQLTTIHMKRDRKIINRTELTRLQQQYESCARDVQTLERSKHKVATAWALAIATIGTLFMAGTVFAITHTPPIYWLTALLSVPALACLICPYLLFRYVVRVQTDKVQPFIDAKRDEIYEVCKKAYSLL